MNDPQFNRFVRTIHYISNRGFGDAAFHIKLVLGHALFLQQLCQTTANCLIQLHSHHRPCNCTRAIIGIVVGKLVPVTVLILHFVIDCLGKEVHTMPDYQKMYYILCAAASKAMDALPRTSEAADAWNILQQALNEAEELYIDTANVLALSKQRPDGQ